MGKKATQWSKRRGGERRESRQENRDPVNQISRENKTKMKRWVSRKVSPLPLLRFSAQRLLLAAGTSRGSLRGMIDVSSRGGEGVGRARVWLAFCGGGGMLPLLTPPNQSAQRLYSPCWGELVGRVMGQGETGLRGNIQLPFSGKELGCQVSLGVPSAEKPNPGVFARGTG